MFEGERILLVALMELALPAKTLRLCDGGFFDWPGRGLFAAFDEDFGTIGSVDAVAENVGDEAPGGRLTLLCPNTAAAVALAQPNAQGAPVRFFMAEADPDSGLIIGTPEQLFDGEVDTVTLQLGRGTAEVAIEYASVAERLFLVAEGNVLSDRFHQRAWPGETGFSQCSGIPVPVPWGTAGPPRGVIGGGTTPGAPSWRDRGVVG